MHITTNSGNTYSYIRRTNEIVSGLVEEQGYEWNFAPLSVFSAISEVAMFIIGITEQCNMRCTYCCYSGSYKHNRTHSYKALNSQDIDEIYDFILRIKTKKPTHIAFYGGEPLLQYALIQYAVERGSDRLGGDVAYSITTNGTMLTPVKMDWLFAHNIEIVISLDGTKSFHDKYRVFPNGSGSFAQVHNVLSYILVHYPHYRHLVSLQMTFPSYKDVEKIAEEWQKNSVLREYVPSNIHGLAANFSQEVKILYYEEVRTFYNHLIDVYEKHQEWAVLRVLLEECISSWKERPILDAGNMIPMSTCLPVNTKLYIDAKKEIGVCEKIADKYRIGNVKDGLDWGKANALAREYYNRRFDRCKFCPAVRMCELCLTAIEYTPKQWDVLCHNERVYARVFMYVFCEMAERGLIK